MNENNENDDNNINFDEEIAYLPIPKIKTKLIEINLKNKLPNKLRRIKMSDLNLHGVENLKKVSIAITSLINAGITSYSDDGKITFGDIGHFIKIIPDILSAIPAISYVKQEITDTITDTELNQLKTAILGTIEIKNELDKDFISQLFDTLHLISKLVANRIERGKEVSS
jgi:hypothetical protein